MVLCCGVLLSSLAAAAFPPLIDRPLFASGFARPVRFSLAHSRQGDRTTFEANYRFRPAKSGQHYRCTIAVAPAGVFLDPARHKQRYEEFRKTYADRGPEFFDSEFPKIGKAAQREMAAGPGGAAWGIVFTTSDGAYDVRVQLSSLLPDGISDPKWDPVAVARRLSERYDERQARPSP